MNMIIPSLVKDFQSKNDEQEQEDFENKLKQEAIKIKKERQIDNASKMWWAQFKWEPGVVMKDGPRDRFYAVKKEGVWELEGHFRNKELIKGVLKWPAKGIVYQGQFKDSMFHGNGTLERTHIGKKIVYQNCIFEKGFPKYGKRLAYNSNSEQIKSTYEGQFQGYHLSGFGVYQQPQKLIYKGEFKNSMFYGYGKLTLLNAQNPRDSWTVEGEFKFKKFVEGSHRLTKIYNPDQPNQEFVNIPGMQGDKFYEDFQLVEEFKDVVAPEEDYDENDSIDEIKVQPCKSIEVNASKQEHVSKRKQSAQYHRQYEKGQRKILKGPSVLGFD